MYLDRGTDDPRFDLFVQKVYLFVLSVTICVPSVVKKRLSTFFR